MEDRFTSGAGIADTSDIPRLVDSIRKLRDKVDHIGKWMLRWTALGALAGLLQLGILILSAVVARCDDITVVTKDDLTVVLVINRETGVPDIYKLSYVCLAPDWSIAAIADTPSGCPKGSGPNPMLTAPYSDELLRKMQDKRTHAKPDPPR